MIGDYGNSLFELIGAFFQVKNCLQIYKDKEIKGVYWPAWLFFTSWGYWNLYYYPSLNQWFSFVAGALMAIANTTWVSLAWYYTHRKES